MKICVNMLTVPAVSHLLGAVTTEARGLPKDAFVALYTLFLICPLYVCNFL